MKFIIFLVLTVEIKYPMVNKELARRAYYKKDISKIIGRSSIQVYKTNMEN